MVQLVTTHSIATLLDILTEGINIANERITINLISIEGNLFDGFVNK